MSWLHTWVGILVGWLLYFMFITGTAGYFDTEIDRWMQPELPVANQQHDPFKITASAQRYLQAHASTANRWAIFFPIDRHEPYPRVFWSGPDGSGNILLNPETQQVLPRRASGGGQLLYKMHWRLHYIPRIVAELVVGIATFFMLLALLTGVVIHRNIFRDFFTFRPNRGRRSWLDAHNMVSVTSLPFQLMITYSGLVFLMFTYMPLIFAALYGFGAEDRQQFKQAISPPGLLQASGQPAALADLSRLLAKADEFWPSTAGAPGASHPIRMLDVRHPGDRNARVIISDSNAINLQRSSNKLIFDGVSGELKGQQGADDSAGRASRELFLGLHEGLFAPLLLRWLYFICGLLGAAMIATGLILWVKKRRRNLDKQPLRAHIGLRLIDKLNVAIVVGLPTSIAAYFWANRLLPLTLPERAEWEVHCLFSTWLLLMLHSLVRPTQRAWGEQLWFAALMFSLLPLLNFVSTERHLVRALLDRDWVMAGFDLSMLLFGVVFAVIAAKLKRQQQAELATAKEASRC